MYYFDGQSTMHAGQQPSHCVAHAAGAVAPSAHNTFKASLQALLQTWLWLWCVEVPAFYLKTLQG